MALSNPSTEQRLLIQLLIQAANLDKLPVDWERHLLVEEMDDGGMGSLRLELSDGQIEHHRFDQCASELRFLDSDGVEVIASLYLDQHQVPFEVDMWKTNFEKLIRIPCEKSLFSIGLSS